MLRLGAELKFGGLAVRGGYGLTTSPEKADLFGEPIDVPAIQNASFGLGYASKKSFFADLACRYAFATDEYFMPYDDYLLEQEVYAPQILNRKDAWKVFLTIGWRF